MTSTDPTDPYYSPAPGSPDDVGGMMHGGPGYEQTNPPVTPTPTPTPEPTTPAPTPTPSTPPETSTPTPTPTYTPPVVDCGPGETPGWLDNHGNPTSCVTDTPTAPPATVTPAPPATEHTVAPAAPAPSTEAVVTVPATPEAPHLADTGLDMTTGIVLAIAASAAVIGGLILRRRDARKATAK